MMLISRVYNPEIVVSIVVVPIAGVSVIVDPIKILIQLRCVLNEYSKSKVF